MGGWTKGDKKNEPRGRENELGVNKGGCIAIEAELPSITIF